MKFRLKGIVQPSKKLPHGVFEPDVTLHLKQNWRMQQCKNPTKFPAAELAEEFSELSSVPDILWSKDTEVDKAYFTAMEDLASSATYEQILKYFWDTYKLQYGKSPWICFMNIGAGNEVTV